MDILPDIFDCLPQRTELSGDFIHGKIDANKEKLAQEKRQKEWLSLTNDKLFTRKIYNGV